MFKRIVISIFLTVIVFISFYSLNEKNRASVNNNYLIEHTPSKFSLIINEYESNSLASPDIIYEDYSENIYRIFRLTPNSYGFLVGTMGYEEEMLVYVELEYVKELIKINTVDILYENETDGYGDYVVESWFLDRFKQETTKEISTVRRKVTDNNQVIAITGATITSDAIVRAVNDCREIMEERNNENE